MRRPFRSYQREAFRYTLGRNACALFMEMRLGKTLVAVRSIDIKGAYPALVVAPYSTLYGWQRELALEGINDVAVLTGTAQQRMQKLNRAIEDGTRWFLLNKEGHRVIPSIANLSWHTVVLDESTFIKNPQTVVSKFYTKRFEHVNDRYILTGTPAPEGLLDYYQQLKFLEPSWLSAKNYWDFRQQHFVNVRYDWRPTKAGATKIHRVLADQCFYMTRKDAGLGGEKIYQRRVVQMPPSIRTAYNTVVKEFVLEGLTGETHETIWATSRFVWLRKLCGGFAGDDFVFDAKINELLYLLLTELKSQQVVIWCNYLHELHAITERLCVRYKGRVAAIYGGVKQEERTAIIRRIASGELDYVVIQPETAKYGVDLSAASTAVFYSTPPGAETRQQAEDRLIASGKLDSSLIIDLVVENSIDEDIVNGVLEKHASDRIHRNIVKRFMEAA